MFTADLESKLKVLENKIKSYFSNTNSKIDAIKTVKSVQRGVVSLGTSASSITITINNVDLNKSIILLQGAGFYSTYSSAPSIYVSSATNTSFIISQHRSSSESVSVSWQVIEFS